jgi:septal ring factor EnvC (AmiA/AmiB activator)
MGKDGSEKTEKPVKASPMLEKVKDKKEKKAKKGNKDKKDNKVKKDSKDKKDKKDKSVTCDIPADDIDSMFNSLAENKAKHKKKLAKIEAEEKRKEKARLEEEKNNIQLQPKTNIISPYAPLHRVDGATGLPVYKAKLLKVGEGGGTSLCPFDCDCCF